MFNCVGLNVSTQLQKIGLFRTANDFAVDCKRLHDTNKRKHD